MASDPMLKKTIDFWEDVLRDKFLMGPSTQTIVEHTVKYLKEFQKIKETESGNRRKNKGTKKPGN
ncbi:hypothetical protein ES703_87989 [subsurface metagenome]